MSVQVRHYAQAWLEALNMTPQKDWPQVSQRMCEYLLKKGKIFLLRQVVNNVEDLICAQSGVVKAQVKTSFQFDQEDLEQVVKELTGAQTVELTIEEMPQLIGGATIQTKDYLWNISMRHDLRALKAHLQQRYPLN